MSSLKARALLDLQMSIVADVWASASLQERKALAVLSGNSFLLPATPWKELPKGDRAALLASLVLIEIAAPALNRARLEVHP